jgi:DNA-binding CsgD family transcriptional regulator
MEHYQLSKHPIITSAGAVRQICQPLFDYFNTTYFNFVRRYIDGSETCLTTDPAWTEYFYTHKFYLKVMADKLARNRSVIHRIKVIPWSHFQDSPVRKAQSELFETGIGITVIFTRDKYADFFHFATHNKNTEMQDLYQSYADCLIQFSHYFYDKGKDLIALVSKKDNRLYLRDRNAYKNEIDFPTLKYFDIENFLETCQSKWFYVYNAKMGDVFLSNVEMVCIRMLTEGKSAKEIAEKLHRSSRTVESHIQNVRNKLGLGKGTSRADLIAEIYRSGFDLHELILKPTHDNIS